MKLVSSALSRSARVLPLLSRTPYVSTNCRKSLQARHETLSEHDMSHIDFKEAFNFGYEPAADAHTPLSTPWPLYDGLKGANVWPRSFREEWKQDIFTYYSEVLDLGRRLMRVFALVLDLSEDSFDHLLVRPGAIMRLLRYPASTLDPDHPGIGAHRDYECKAFTSFSGSLKKRMMTPEALRNRDVSC